MKKIIVVYILLFVAFIHFPLFSQQTKKTDANIVGHVTSGGKHLQYVSVVIQGTAIGTMTDATGHYMLVNLPVGKHIVHVQTLGFKPQEKEIELIANVTKEVNFDLEEDVLGLEAVVVTGNRSVIKRSSSPVVINTVSPKLFSAIQSTQMREGLDFCPGLRTETNCQNCGFSQLRINGMEGAYSQILINGHPIFSSLAGVYGLEMIPSNMIDRIEVVRGGGSALYGSNAIAGTVNIMLKDPLSNTFSTGVNTGVTGVGVPGSRKPAQDISVQTNTSVVSSDHMVGMALFGYYQNKSPFDANDDGFSELPKVNNSTFGIRGFHRLGYHSKLTVDFFNIKESRRGGDRFDEPEHEAGIAESINHLITTGSATYDLFLHENDQFSAFISAQGINRKSYYGAHQSLKDYGHTGNLTYVTGLQYKTYLKDLKLITGIERRGENLKDRKMGYPDFENALIVNDTIVSIPHVPNTIVAMQNSATSGIFFQSEYRIFRWTFSAGLRYDHYVISDKLLSGKNNSGNVFSPRINIKFDISQALHLRGNVSKGYRAPQIFDEDLHIESSGSRQVIIKNAPDLKQETSRSYGLSLDLHKEDGNIKYEFLMDGFYTRLIHPFVNTYGSPDEKGVVIYTRINADEGAVVQGINLEMNVVPAHKVKIKTGWTIQNSEYSKSQDFNETHFLRTPNSYGYAVVNVEPTTFFSVAVTYNYTGKMLVPYFGADLPDPNAGTLRKSPVFHNVGTKMSYTFTLNGTKIRLYAALKNMFNAYQKDFDKGINRDPGYIYGPAYPRTIYFGIKFGNTL